MTGLEPATSGSTVPHAPDANTTNPSTSSDVGTPGAVPGAVAGEVKGEHPDGLARVVEAWPTLPEPLRRAVLAIVAATG